MKAKKRVIPYSCQSIDERERHAVAHVLSSDWITQGPMIERFEKALCRYTKAKYAVALSSGTAGLHVALHAIGVGDGDKVIVPAISFAATANAVLYCGAKPIFADVDPLTGLMSNSHVEDLLKKAKGKVKAIVPVHFAGQMCQMRQLRVLSKKYGARIIEDACHAIGAQYKRSDKSTAWQRVGDCSFSEACVFSFHPVKPITTGEGGAVLTNSKRLYESMRRMRMHGISSGGEVSAKGDYSKYSSLLKKEIVFPWFYEMQELGCNYRITDMQCSMGIEQLKKLNRFIARRRQLVKKYAQSLSDNDYFTILSEGSLTRSSWHLYPILFNDRMKEYVPELFVLLRSRGIGVQKHYIPIYHHPYYQGRGYKKGLCPHAEDFYARQMSIPLFQSLTDNDQVSVVDELLELCAFVERKTRT